MIVVALQAQSSQELAQSESKWKKLIEKIVKVLEQVVLELQLDADTSSSGQILTLMGQIGNLKKEKDKMQRRAGWNTYFGFLKCTYADVLKIDGQFPSWISTQFSFEILELTNASLVGVIPSWLWETNPLLSYLNLSRNHLEGILSSNTSTWMQLEVLDVSRNAFSGHLPSMWSSHIFWLNLANNFFTGNIPPSLGKLSNLSILNLENNLFRGNIPPSLGKLSNLQMLNLANNNIARVIPMSLSNCSSLVILNLGNNTLEGSLPNEFSMLSELHALVVHNNNLNGSFPSLIINCSKLQVLDIGNNLFGGKIPTLIGNLSELKVLVMKENNFTGSIPLEMGQLMNLQILLLSSNHISSSIPHTIVFLQAMTKESQNGFILFNFQATYQVGLDMNAKGTYEHYTYILYTVTCMDLSNNELEGEVPSEIGNLKWLRLLNLSMNNLKGTIPNSLGEMHQLDSLDLSRNYFSGKIPLELQSLSYLGSLNLADNNLSGSIPQGPPMTTFGESSYSRNPNLWGCPLPKNCSWPHFLPPPPTVSINKRMRSTRYPWYEIALGLSYGAAFGGIMSLILLKTSWRRKYFIKVDTILKFLFPWMKNLTL
ncbi:LRR receptor-like serine/threonine-protein kinase SIK1 [Cryptomeria japonica]|uniref:LRR receptor-like serine/threonine-protein kinase SIK1 n=1 Tax=Cryptomeria japonica TaxID=3369 RepID=UPI0027DA28E4|nr:LRR receptor-like serine/threonine-protein kinase SIK1 [Cryptomeria japonica]